MLIHRVAAFFGMEHNVDHTQQCVIAGISKATRVPEVYIVYIMIKWQDLFQIISIHNTGSISIAASRRRAKQKHTKAREQELWGVPTWSAAQWQRFGRHWQRTERLSLRNATPQSEELRGTGWRVRSRKVAHIQGKHDGGRTQIYGCCQRWWLQWNRKPQQCALLAPLGRFRQFRVWWIAGIDARQKVVKR